MNKLFLILLIPFFALPAQAKHPHLEKEYQHVWCDAHGGKTEVVLKDRVRVDCVTKTHAVEFDFAEKWAESIGQSLYYSKKTRKAAGVIFVLGKCYDNLDKPKEAQK